jgi:transcriptional repressor of dcmA and dcmR
MERLLNVKEAANFLNVSEMTIRRWTNSGDLRCYRVGGKRERRFQAQDLRDCLNHWSAQPLNGGGMIRFGVGETTVPDGSHFAHLGVSGPEMLLVGISYLLEGVTNQETVLLVTSNANLETFVNTLEAKGVDVGRASSLGRLYISQGMDAPQAMATYISQTVASSPGRFRLFGDMTWVKERGWSLDSIRQLEELCKDSPPEPGRLFLCQYSLAAFSGQEAMMAAETHRHTLYKGTLQESPYFASH